MVFPDSMYLNNKYHIANPKFSGGGGLRFQLLKSNPTLIRMDIGINQYGGTSFYFGVNEVF